MAGIEVGEIILEKNGSDIGRGVHVLGAQTLETSDLN